MSSDRDGFWLTPAGEMPRSWRATRLRELTREVTERAGDQDGLPVLSVTKHRGIVRADAYFNKAVHSRDTANYKVVRKGQFAYATIHLDEGSIGRLTSEEAGLVSPMYTVFEVTGDLDRDFLLALLKSPPYLGRYAALGQGTINRRASISFESLGTLVIHNPPLAEQRAISTVLRAAADTVARTLAVIEKLQTAKFWTMRELLTHGHPAFVNQLRPFRESWPMGRVAPKVDKVPAHWALVRMTEVARLESGHTPSRDRSDYWNGGIPWISLQDTDGLQELEITQTRETVSDLGIQNSSARVLPKGTVVFLRTASVGLCSLMGRDMATSQHFANWVCGPKIDRRYLVQLFRHMKREWRRLQAGSVLPDVYMPVFENLQILLPPREEQAAIAAVGEAFDRRIAAERACLDQLQQTKRGLAQALLSGRVRVPQRARRREEA